MHLNWSKHTLRYDDFFDVTCEYRPVPTESSDAQQPQGHSSTSTFTVGVDAECGPRANYATSTSGPESCASSLAPASLQLSQYGVARSPFNVNATEFCPDTPYFTSDTDRALLPDEDSEQTYLKQQQLSLIHISEPTRPY